MIYESIQQDLGLWEAWIEFDPIHPESFGTLYVVGEVETGLNCSPVVIKCAHSCNPSQLVLHIHAPAPGKSGNLAEVVYSEPVNGIGQYTVVTVYWGDTVVVQMKDIEVII